MNRPNMMLTRLTAVLVFALAYQYAFAQDIQNNPERDYQNAIRLYEEGLFDESVQSLERFLESDINSELRESALYYLARARTATDSVHIVNHYEAYAALYPKTERTGLLYSDLGRRFDDNGEYESAIEYYENSLDCGIADEKSAETIYWMAEASANNGNNEQAREYFLQLANEHPDSEWAPKALYARGRIYLSESNYDESTVAFELLKERYPNNPITRRVGTALGESYYQKGEYEEAIQALRNAIPFLDDESRSKAVILIAESHNYLDNYERASVRYLEYINLNKGTDKVKNAYYGLGWLYYKQQIYHWASDAFSKAIDGDDELSRKALYYKAVNEKLGNRYSQSYQTFEEFGERFKTGLWVEEAYYEWAISAFEGGQYGDAIEILLSLVRNQDQLNKGGQVFTLLGEAYFANGEFTRAIQAFEEASKTINLDPKIKEQAKFQKAWVLFRNQAFESAQPIFEEIYRENPESEIGREALFWSADSYYSQKQYGRAANQFATFVRNNEDHELIGAARYSLGWAYFIMADYEKAVGPLEDFINNYNPPPIALFPYDTDTRLRLGDAYYAMGEYSNALKFYNQAIGAEPGGDYAMFQVGNSYYRANRTFEAVSTFRKLLRIYPYSRLREQAQYNIAYIYLNTSNYAQAVEEFQTVISKYPRTRWAARSQYNIGDAYYNAGEYDQAILEYKKVLDQYPRSSYIIEAINGIQYAQLSGGAEDSSSILLEDFLEENPRSSTADQLRFRQAENIYQSGDYLNAIKELRQYLRVTNSYRLAPSALTYLAEAYLQTGQTDRAKDTYQQIIDEYPSVKETAPAITELGRIYFVEDNYQRSHDLFMLLLQTQPRFKQEAYIGMGNASLAQRDFDKALVEYDEAIKINPRSDAAKIGLGKVAVEKDEYEKAESLLRDIADSNTTETGAEAQYYLGKLKQDQNLLEDAINEYSKVKVLYEAFDNWVSLALFHTAESQIRLGNRGDALNTLNTIISDYPGTPSAIQAQALLNTLN